MGTESVEAQMARIDEQLKNLATELKEARNSRRDQYQKFHQMNNTLTEMSGRIHTVETSLARSAPTIEEFITIKHKVVGAGLAGRWLWAVLAFLIGIIAATKTNIAAWFS